MIRRECSVGRQEKRKRTDPKRKTWYELEGVKGAEYRWIGARASAVLKPVVEAPQRLRIRGQAHDLAFARNQPAKIRVSVNGALLREMRLERSGLFVFEADLPDAREYRIDIEASPTFTAPPDDRLFCVTISMIRLIPR